VPYDLDPTLTDVPIHASELEQIVTENAKEVLKDQRKFSHLMGRVIATLRSRHDTIQQLTRDINQMRSQSEHVGRAPTLNPVDMMRFLSDEQRAQMCGKMMQEQQAAMQREVQKAQNVQRLSNQVLNRTKYALLALAEDSTLPMAARQRVQEVLASIESGGPGSMQGSPSSTGWQQPQPGSAPGWGSNQPPSDGRSR
jgi:hypothetical protein